MINYAEYLRQKILAREAKVIFIDHEGTINIQLEFNYEPYKKLTNINISKIPTPHIKIFKESEKENHLKPLDNFGFID